MLSAEHDSTHEPHLYDNGCSLCDWTNDLAAIAEFGIGVPWANEEYDEQSCVELIRRILETHKGTRHA